MTNHSDQELLHLIHIKRDVEAFEVLYGRYIDLTYRVARGILKDHSRSEDMAQKTFIHVFNKCSLFRSSKNTTAKNWIIRILVNECYMDCRKAKVRKKHEERVVSEQATKNLSMFSSGNDDAKTELQEVVVKLPENYRTPIQLHFYEGLDMQSVAETMSIPLETVRTRIKRAMAKIKNSLRQTSSIGVPAMLMDVAEFEKAVLCPEATSLEIFSRIESQISGFNTPLGEATTTPGGSGASLISSSPMTYIVSILITGIVVGSFWLINLSGVRPSTGDPSSSPDSTYLSLDFNQSKQVEQIHVESGLCKYVLDGGPDGSGGLLVIGKEGTDVFKAAFSEKIQLPLRVSLKFKRPRKAFFMLTGAVVPSGKSDIFKNIGRNTVKGEWVQLDLYITEEYILRVYNNSDINSFVITKPSEGSKFKLFVKSISPIMIDDFFMRTITDEELPDVDYLLKAYHSIPLEKRFGNVDLPMLTTGVGRKSKVYIKFE